MSQHTYDPSGSGPSGSGPSGSGPSASGAGCELRISTEALSAWRDAQLSRAEAERIAYHAPTCRACADRLSGFEAVAGALRQQPTPEPRPTLWRETQQRLAQERPRAPETRPNANTEHRAIRSTYDADTGSVWNEERRMPEWSTTMAPQTQRPSNPSNPSNLSTATQPWQKRPAISASRAWRTVGAAAAAVLVVGLLIGVLVSRHGLRLGGAPKTTPTTATTATATSTSTPTSNAGPWQVVANGLGNGDALATSNPNIVYAGGIYAANSSKFSPNVVTLQRSDDDGAHWTKLALPTPNGQTILAANIIVLELAVSPINADTAFLTLQTDQAGLCSSPGFATPVQPHQQPVGNKLDASVLAGLVCQMQFVSVDGGANWRQLSLPTLGLLGIAQIQPADNLTQDAFKAQGTRLYSTVVDVGLASSGTIPPGRLVASDDGGVTWKLVDAQLAAQGQAIYDYMPAPSGNTIFVVTEPAGAPSIGGSYTAPNLELWRSADGGASWVKVGGVPNNADNGMRVTVGSNGQPILYMDTAGLAKSGASQAASTIEVSVDGGATWTHAPDVSGGVTKYSTLLGVLADGSVVMQFNDNSFRAWKQGSSAWRTVAPAPPLTISSLQSAAYTFALLSTDSAGHSTIWLYVTDSTGASTASLLVRAEIA